MQQYKNLVRRIRDHGTESVYRNGVRRSVFGVSLEFNLQERFPLVDDKETKYHDAFVDLLWMISGSSKISMLDKLGMKFNFWRKWGVNGSIGNLYGRAWRHAPNNGFAFHRKEVLDSGAACPSDVNRKAWTNNASHEVDQLANVIYGLKNNPNSSRHRITTYIPAWASNEEMSFEENYHNGKGVITPCACFLHFTVEGDTLNLHVTQASSDVLIGLPVNIAQYALLLTLVARECDFTPSKLFYTISDAHIYGNQKGLLEESGMLEREDLENDCRLLLIGDSDIYHIGIEDVKVEGYEYHPFIPFVVSE